jgi:hypothetical protein
MAGRKLRFGVEVLDHDFENPAVLSAVEENIPRYGIEEILFWGGINILDQDVTVPGFEAYDSTSEHEKAERFRSWLARYKKQDVLLVADGREPAVSAEFFEAYPEARVVNSGLLWEYLEKRTEAVFRKNPNLDRIESFLWESWLLNDQHYFRGMGGGYDEWWKYPRSHEPVEYLIEMISAFVRGARTAGKEYAQKGFPHQRWQEDILVEAISRVPLDLPLRTSTQMQFGDFNPMNPAPRLVRANLPRPLTMYCDCFGEYLGRSQVPYCHPEVLQQRLQWALETNASLDAVRGRINFADGWNRAKTTHIFGTVNEINIVALSRLCQDPYASVADIWQDWATERYGKAAAEPVIRALRRSVPIVRGAMLLYGVTLPRHSEIPSFDGIEFSIRSKAHVAPRVWPEYIEENAILRKLADAPDAYVLDEVLRPQENALRLAAESVADIESARKSLSTENYAALKDQFEFTERFCRIYRNMMELFVRVRMAPDDAPSGNDEAINRAAAELKKHADYAEAHHDADSIVQGGDIRAFVDAAASYDPAQNQP